MLYVHFNTCRICCLQAQLQEGEALRARLATETRRATLLEAHAAALRGRQGEVADAAQLLASTQVRHYCCCCCTAVGMAGW